MTLQSSIQGRSCNDLQETFLVHSDIVLQS